MKIYQLIPTQDGLRLSVAEMERMRNYVKAGGTFALQEIEKFSINPPRTIAISQCDDGKLYIRDGIHRVCAILLGGRTSLLTNEYVIEQLTYERYCTPRLDCSWFTPFDPRIEVRIPNFLVFKTKVEELLKKYIDPIPYIKENKFLYCVPRRPCHASPGALCHRFLPSLT